MDDDVNSLDTPVIATKAKTHAKCKGRYDSLTGDYWCDYDTTLTCDECKYGIGRKDPEAKCNRDVYKAAPKEIGT